MKPSSQKPVSIATATSATTASVQTLTAPANAAGCMITVETTNANMTFDGTTPASAAGHVIPKDQPPLFLPIGNGTVINFTSTAAANSVVKVTWTT